MAASTHTDIYRPFRGTLERRALRCLPLARSGIRTAAKRKLPMLLLFAPPAIATVIFSFVVYLKFAVAAGATPEALGGAGPAVAIVVKMADKLIEVRHEIVLFHLAMSAFTLLVIAWYGAGAIAEDRRLGAHLLYFARPLTVLDYLLGKLIALAFFGGLVVLVPGLVICAIAAFSSPDWSFLKEEGDVVPKTIGFALLWVAVWSSVMLAISSLFSRKTFALVASFALVLVSEAVAGVLSALLRDGRWQMLSPGGNMRRIAVWMFDMPGMGMRWPVVWSFAIVAALTAAAWIVLVLRVRRMEAVG